MDIFEKASREKLRFTLGGSVSTEQLWDSNIDQLIDYEADLIEIIEKYGTKNRRNKRKVSRNEELDALRLEIVSHILNVREQELEAAKIRAEQKRQEQKILEVISRKKDAALENMSIEDLEKLLQ